MPLFEYVCNKCRTVNEILAHPGEKEQVICEKCGSAELTKKISRVSVCSKSGDSDFSNDMPSCDSCHADDGESPMPPCAGVDSCGL